MVDRCRFFARRIHKIKINDRGKDRLEILTSSWSDARNIAEKSLGGVRDRRPRYPKQRL